MAYLNVSNFELLENTVKVKAAAQEPGAEEDLSYLKSVVISCANYVLRVTEEQIETRFARCVLKGEDLRRVIEHFDGTRHTAHEQAIVAVRALNRMAAMYGTGKIYLGDENVRREIGDFCGEIVQWFFANRT